MSYTQHTWFDGEVITAALLNNMESGIADASSRLDEIDMSEYMTVDMYNQMISEQYEEYVVKGFVSNDTFDAYKTEAQTYVDNAESTAKEYTDNMVNQINTNVSTIVDQLNENIASIVNDLNTSIAGVQSSVDEVKESIPEAVDTSSLVSWTSDATNSAPDRKTIVLNNRDSIQGYGVSGDELYNIARITQNDRIHLGAAKLELNLRSLNDKVKINNSKVVATLDDVEAASPDLSNYVTSETLDSYVTTDYLTNNYMNKAGVVSFVTSYLPSYMEDNNYITSDGLGDYVTADSLTETLSDYATTDTYNSLQESITNSYTSLISEVGNTLGEAIQTKQDKLTAGDGVTISDENVISVDLSDVTGDLDLSGYVKTEDLTSTLEGYATADALTEVDTQIDDLEEKVNDILSRIDILEGGDQL